MADPIYITFGLTDASLACVQDIDIDIGMMDMDLPAIAVSSSLIQHKELPLLQDWLPPLSKQWSPTMVPSAREKDPHKARHL